MENELDASPLEDESHLRVLNAMRRLFAIESRSAVDTVQVAADLVRDVLQAEKVDIFLYDPERDMLVAAGMGDTPLNARQHALGLDTLPLAEGGRSVEVYRTGALHRDGHVERDEGELEAVRTSLGVRSSLIVPLTVESTVEGIILATSTRNDAFTPDDARLLDVLARITGMLVERTRIAAARAELDRLKEAERMRSEFLATVSHDLQTPLTAMRAGLGLLEMSGAEKLTGEERELLCTARRNVDRLRVRVNDLLTANQMEAGTLRLSSMPLDLRVLTQRALDLMLPLLHEANHEVHVDLPDALPTTGDSQRLEQVVINLLSNTYRHTPAGTPVTIEGRLAEDVVTLRVIDKGPGIPAHALDGIFQPFFRLHTDAPGSGLGLAVARAVVERMGGHIWAESEPDVGAVFTVQLHRRAENTSDSEKSRGE